jgi:hypothetical protein
MEKWFDSEYDDRLKSGHGSSNFVHVSLGFPQLTINYNRLLHRRVLELTGSTLKFPNLRDESYAPRRDQDPWLSIDMLLAVVSDG